ncbi:hypothetical protein HMPREF1531_00702 [Propionibacterium sp. oral taxon 192 str. F0372]|uniref:acyl carrier protein n=1 Tax=Propionibacterium sp. oral taxon 192 TaxID=671222 RepID=UPI0003541F3E|nr:acyl carrier protein [Propionibacterium sp. oral taxon 192]EPH06054.1 hypothetical protein HMPREF1531_00702 [Propionibacterium sp. oral taxon 192 str. F0372]
MNQHLIDALGAYCEPGTQLSEDLHLVTDLGMTSFDLIQALGDLEMATGKGIDVDELNGIATVGDLNSVVNRALNAD